MRNRTTLTWNKILKPIFSIIFILLIWEAAALIVNDEFFMPDVFKTWESLVNILASDTFFKTVFTAFYRVCSGLILGIIFGILLAALCHKFDWLNTLVSPIISIMKATPVASIIVLLWIRMNYTEIAVFVVVLMILPIIWQNVYDGFKATDEGLIEVTNVFRLTKLQRLRILVIPSILSYLLPAVITSVGLGWKAEIAAEIMTSSNIGRLIYDFKTVSYDTASIFAWTVIIVSLSVIFEKTAKYFLGRIINDFKT